MSQRHLVVSQQQDHIMHVSMHVCWNTCTHIQYVHAYIFRSNHHRRHGYQPTNPACCPTRDAKYIIRRAVVYPFLCFLFSVFFFFNCPSCVGVLLCRSGHQPTRSSVLNGKEISHIDPRCRFFHIYIPPEGLSEGPRGAARLSIQTRAVISAGWRPRTFLSAGLYLHEREGGAGEVFCVFCQGSICGLVGWKLEPRMTILVPISRELDEARLLIYFCISFSFFVFFFFFFSFIFSLSPFRTASA